MVNPTEIWPTASPVRPGLCIRLALQLKSGTSARVVKGHRQGNRVSVQASEHAKGPMIVVAARIIGILDNIITSYNIHT